MSIGQKQSIGSLRYYLYDRPLHPELFEIYHDHHVIKPAYEAQIWVTGCTHVIGFYREKLSMVEVIADADTELSERGRLLDLAFRGERDHERRRAGGINYMMNFQVESMSPTVYSQTHHELARLGTQRGLFVPFPMWMARSLTPFTYIDYDAKPNELHVFTFHAFPEDLTIVKTQSIFEVG
ncbi:MAG TPA: DUF2617 family protein [Phycisphaerae bacterium]|nr:DUF2617 family protein [Phycisphaerae bacterium]